VLFFKKDMKHEQLRKQRCGKGGEELWKKGGKAVIV
jgi:hypothetical protein